MSKLAGKVVTVTGAKGFIGQRLVERLKKMGFKVKTINSLENINLPKNSMIVFHLAAVTNPKADPYELNKVNYFGTKNLLKKVLRDCPDAVFIFPSTFGVYRTPNEDEVIKENYPKNPTNDYGKSKLKAEDMVQKFSDQFNLKVRILRLSNVYGPNSSSVITRWLKAIKNNEQITLTGDSNQSRDFIYIDDVVKALILSATQKLEQKSIVLNICTGEDISLKQLLDFMLKIAKVRIKILNERGNLSNVGFFKGDFSLAYKLLKWTPKVTLKKGLKLTWESIN